MAHTRAARAPAGDDRRSPRKVVLAGGLDGQSNKPKITQPQALRADLIGSSTCTAAGITATGHAPVLALCRRLIAAGYDPDQALEVYRAAVLALTVRSIGVAARLTVRESTSDGRPRFARLNGDGSPPIQNYGPTGNDAWTDWPAASAEGGAA
jgi:hypothetical protein